MDEFTDWLSTHRAAAVAIAVVLGVGLVLLYKKFKAGNTNTSGTSATQSVGVPMDVSGEGLAGYLEGYLAEQQSAFQSAGQAQSSGSAGDTSNLFTQIQAQLLQLESQIGSLNQQSFATGGPGSPGSTGPYGQQGGGSSGTGTTGADTPLPVVQPAGTGGVPQVSSFLSGMSAPIPGGFTIGGTSPNGTPAPAIPTYEWISPGGPGQDPAGTRELTGYPPTAQPYQGHTLITAK